MKSLDRNVVIGTPLMDEEKDVTDLAKVLHQESDVKAALQNGLVVFMGHGNPEGYDYYGGNIRYLELEEQLRAKSENYYVGTVDMHETYAENVLQHIAGGTFDIHKGKEENSPIIKTVNYEANTAENAQLFVLMSIAGDHAHNDMAEDWLSMFNDANIKTKAYETNFKEACWKNTEEIKKKGYIPGLAERKAVRKLWIEHTRAAIAKLGTEDALSTPTTEPDDPEEE
jgi:sirohydrochlorin cobaltochelatase